MGSDIGRGDRRLQRRFPVELDLEYRIIEQGRVVSEGCGRTGNMSSAGLMFRAEHGLVYGHSVELSIRWPAVLDNVPFVELHVTGRIVRNDANGTAVQILRHRFHNLENAGAAYDRLPARALIH